MLSHTKLSGNARRFKTLMGMSLLEFNLSFAKVEETHPETEMLSKSPRRRAIGAGRRFALDLRNRVLLLLFYYRTYATPDVAAEAFGVGQATVSRSIDQIAPVIRQCVPIPAKIHYRAKRALALEDLEEILPGLRCLIDVSEQLVQRPKRKDMEKSHYSGKAGRHTAKVQYTVNTNGLIVHNTRHSPGRVHDVRVYRMKHTTSPSGLSSRDESDGKGGGEHGCRSMWTGATRGRRRCTKRWKYWRRSGGSQEKSSWMQQRRSTGCTPRSASTWSTPSTGSTQRIIGEGCIGTR